MRWRVSWALLGLVVLTGLVSIFAPIASSSGWSLLSVLGAAILPGLAVPAFIVGVSRLARKHVRRASDKEFRVCWGCGYELHGLSDAGKCPECERAYEIAELQRKWGRFAEQVDPKQPPRA